MGTSEEEIIGSLWDQMKMEKGYVKNKLLEKIVTMIINCLQG